MTRGLLGVLAAVSLAAAGCGNSPLPAPAVPAAPVASTPAPAPKPVGAVSATAATPAPLVPSLTLPESNAPSYEAKGRRDPFAEIQTVSGSGGLLVATTKLTGIVRSARSTLALVETAEGIGYILKPGDTLGDGRLLEIGADSVVFAVTLRAGSSSNRVVLRLAAN